MILALGVLIGVTACNPSKSNLESSQSQSSGGEEMKIPEGYIPERASGLMFDEPPGVQIYN